MKRFVLVALSAALMVCADAQEASEILERYAKSQGSTYVALDKKTFNIIKPMLKLDKETKQLFKLLDLKTMDMLQIEKGEVASRARADFETLRGNSLYKSVAQQKKDELEEGTDCLFKIEEDRVTEFLMYSVSPKDSSFVVMRLDCNSELEKLSEFIP